MNWTELVNCDNNVEQIANHYVSISVHPTSFCVRCFDNIYTVNAYLVIWCAYKHI